MGEIITKARMIEKVKAKHPNVDTEGKTYQQLKEILNQNPKPENPFVFPMINDELGVEFQGITLRDYFAAKAMQGTQLGFDQECINEQARLAYKIADAMLEQREN